MYFNQAEWPLFEISSMSISNSSLDYQQISLHQNDHMNSIGQAQKVCYTLGIITLIKLTIVLWVCQQQFTSSDMPHQPTTNILICLMTIYDILYVLLNLIVSIKITNVPLVVLQQQSNEFPFDTNIQGFVISEIWSSLWQPINGMTALNKFDRYDSRLANCAEVLRVYFMLLYVLIVITVFIENPSDIQITIYLICGFIYLSIPLFLSVIWPILLIVVICRRDPHEISQPQPINMQILDMLKSIKYQDIKSIGSGGCPICYSEFSETQTIIQLPCHSKHYFHAECCRDWLKSKDTCPICRQTV